MRNLSLLGIILLVVLTLGLEASEAQSPQEFSSKIGVISPRASLGELEIEEFPLRTKLSTLQEIISELDADVGEVSDILVVGSEGQIRPFTTDGYFQKSSDSLAYLSEGNAAQIPNVIGLILDPPDLQNADAFEHTREFLERNHPVLLAILDGFGYHQYIKAVATREAPFLSSLKPARRALSVYPPITNAGLAAILTGTTPDVNGIHSRQHRTITGSDIFETTDQLGKRSVYITGDRQVILTSGRPELTIDTNRNGSTDDEIVKRALATIQQGPDLLVIHLKDIDRCGHTYGDEHPETMAAIRKTDAYLEQLVSRWPGVVIVTADHGMHQNRVGGNHGQFRAEDMFVPYIIIGRE